MSEKVKLNIISKTPVEKKFKKPLVFIHGMFQGSWVWEEHFLDFFVSKGFECHLLNLRGHNGSTHSGQFRFISIADYVEDLKSVLSALDDDPIVIAHSMGGFIVQKYLENHTLPLSILMSPVPPRGVGKPTLKVLSTYPHLFLWANLTLSLQPIVNNKNLMKKLMFTSYLPEETYSKLYPKHQNESFRAYFEMLLLKWIKVKKIHSKVEFIGTTDDYSISESSVRQTARKYGIEPKIFTKGGHCPMVAEGWEDVADYIFQKINEFVNSQN